MQGNKGITFTNPWARCRLGDWLPEKLTFVQISSIARIINTNFSLFQWNGGKILSGGNLLKIYAKYHPPPGGNFLSAPVSYCNNEYVNYMRTAKFPSLVNNQLVWLTQYIPSKSKVIAHLFNCIRKEDMHLLLTFPVYMYNL